MSAINPASFQTPAGGLQLPGGVGSATLTGDFEQYPNRRQPRQHTQSLSAGQAQPALGTSNLAWAPNRDCSIDGGMAFSHVYPSPLPPIDPDIRQLDHSSINYLNMHASFHSSGNKASNLHHGSSFNLRSASDDRRTQSSQALGKEWNRAFHGLSLGP